MTIKLSTAAIGFTFAFAFACAGADSTAEPSSGSIPATEEAVGDEPAAPVESAETDPFVQARIDALQQALAEGTLDMDAIRELKASDAPIVFDPAAIPTGPHPPPGGGVDALSPEILEAVRSLGYSTDRAAVNQGWVIVEGDILLDPEVLLSGGYGARIVEKGYKFGGANVIDESKRGNIKLAMDPFFASSQKGVIAAWYAGTMWSQAGAINIDFGNTGSAITIRVSQNPPCIEDEANGMACARPPVEGRPGGEVWLKLDLAAVTSGDCTWTFATLLMTLAHELGHAIGMAHPGDYTHIEDTEPCFWGPFPSVCLQNPLYATIMSYANYDGATCTVYNSDLKQDDHDSVAALYPR